MFVLLTLLACPPPVLKPVDDTQTDSEATDDSRTDDSAPCEHNVLEYSALTRDGGDIQTDTFREGSVLKAVGVVHNPCTAELSFETSSSCLVRRWVASDGTVEVEAEFGCDDALTSWTVPAGGEVEEVLVFQPELGLGTWTLTAEFDFGGNSATTQLTVTEDTP